MLKNRVWLQTRSEGLRLVSNMLIIQVAFNFVLYRDTCLYLAPIRGRNARNTLHKLQNLTAAEPLLGQHSADVDLLSYMADYFTR